MIRNMSKTHKEGSLGKLIETSHAGKHRREQCGEIMVVAGSRAEVDMNMKNVKDLSYSLRDLRL